MSYHVCTYLDPQNTVLKQMTNTFGQIDEAHTHFKVVHEGLGSIYNICTLYYKIGGFLIVTSVLS